MSRSWSWSSYRQVLRVWSFAGRNCEQTTRRGSIEQRGDCQTDWYIKAKRILGLLHIIYLDSGRAAGSLIRRLGSLGGRGSSRSDVIGVGSWVRGFVEEKRGGSGVD